MTPHYTSLVLANKYLLNIDKEQELQNHIDLLKAIFLEYRITEQALQDLHSNGSTEFKSVAYLGRSSFSVTF